MNTTSVPRPSDAGDLPDFLFDPLPPEAVDAPADDAEPLLAMTRRIGRNLGALIGLFFVSLIFFVICVSLFSLGAGLAVVVVGLFVLVACLMAAAVLSRATK